MMLILLLTLVSVVFIHGESIETRCCLPEQGDFVQNGTVCLNFDTNIETKVRLSCTESTVTTVTMTEFISHANGSLSLYPDGFNLLLQKGTYCLERNPSNETQKVLAMCLESLDPKDTIVDTAVLGFCLMVSVLFLALTAITYCIVPELRDVQGKIIINFCSSFAIGLLLLGIIKMGFENSHMAFCAIQGFLMYFFILGGFFWINAISIQMFLSIRRPSAADYSWRTFGWYALYAWGCPALLTICLAIVNFHPEMKPVIMLVTCWFYSKSQQWYYLYSIISILIITNISIFIYLSIHLWRHTFSSTLTKELRYKFLMTLRMFIITGFPWIFEIISTFFEEHIRLFTPNVWVAFDIFITLQGPLIFLVLVVFRPRAIKGLHNLGLLSCISGLVEKHLAVVDDAEEPIQQTIDVQMDDKS